MHLQKLIPRLGVMIKEIQMNSDFFPSYIYISLCVCCVCALKAFPAQIITDLCLCSFRIEECDDGNLLDRDGCSKTCSMEPGFNCVGK